MRINGLTKKQHRVAELVHDGLTDKEIAAVLDIGEDGVAYHVARIAAVWELNRKRNIRVQIATKWHDSLGVSVVS